MANFPNIVARIADAANAWLPSDYALGYSIPHDVPLAADDPAVASAPEDLAHVATHSAIRLAEHRRDMLRYAQRQPSAVTQADLDALPTTGRYIIVEIVHQPTGIIAFKAYSYDTIRDIVIGPGTVTTKRTALRNQMADLLLACQQRVTAAGG